MVFVYTHGNDSLDILSGWPYKKVRALAFLMQDQMFPGSKPTASKSTAPKQEGFKSGETIERRGGKKIKTTNISFKDMFARAKAGIDTSIRGL